LMKRGSGQIRSPVVGWTTPPASSRHAVA
jgi:hypothetical protein